MGMNSKIQSDEIQFSFLLSPSPNFYAQCLQL